jgi:hypothetical protein
MDCSHELVHATASLSCFGSVIFSQICTEVRDLVIESDSLVCVVVFELNEIADTRADVSETVLLQRAIEFGYL